MLHRQGARILDQIGQTGGKFSTAFLFCYVTGGNTTSFARRLDNRAIASAAAQVPGQRIIDRPAIIFAAIQPHLIQAHDKARRAEPALRSMGLNHRLLHRVQAAIFRFQMLHGQKLLAIKGRDKLNAGIHRAIGHFAITIGFAKNHGAGPTIPLGTAFFGAGFAFFKTQVIKNRHLRINTA